MPVVLDERQRNEKNETGRRNRFGGPDSLPNREDVIVDKFALEVQEKPSVAKVEVRVIAVLVHQFEHLCVQYLDQRSHIGEVCVHCAAVREVGHHSLHQLTKAAKGQHL